MKINSLNSKLKLPPFNKLIGIYKNNLEISHKPQLPIISSGSFKKENLISELLFYLKKSTGSNKKKEILLTNPLSSTLTSLKPKTISNKSKAN